MMAIRNSLALVLAGIYLLGAGALAPAVRHILPRKSLPLDGFIIFMTLASLTVLLLSNRFRWQLRRFVSRHFHRPIYDCQRVWMELTERTASSMDVDELSTAVCRIVPNRWGSFPLPSGWSMNRGAG